MSYPEVVTYCVAAWIGGWWGGLACAIWLGLWLADKKPKRVDRRETWRQIYSRENET